MTRYTHRHIVVNNVRLMYLEWQPDEASSEEPLFLLHGLLATAETFMDLMDNLPKSRRLVALDLLSAQPVQSGEKLNVHFASLANLIQAFMHAVGLVRPVVIGHSHGGVLALRIAASQSDLLRGLVLMCPAHPFAGYRSHVVQFYLKPHGRFLALSIPFAPKWAILRAYRQATGPNSDYQMVQLKAYMRVLRSRKTLATVLEMLATWETDMSDLSEALLASPVTLPALLLWGDHDDVVPMSSAELLEQRLTRSERVTMPGLGHLLAEEAPVACGKYISDWLARQQ